MTAALLAMLCLAAPSGVDAHDTVSAAPAPVQGAFAPTQPSTPTALAASLQTGKTGTEYQATFRPGAYWDRTYSLLYSELALTLSADSATSRTRFALGQGYNPFAVKGRRAVERLEQATKRVDCSGLAEAATACRLEGCPEREQQDRDDAVQACGRRQLHEQWKAVHSGWVPAVFVTGIFDVFPGGEEPSPDDPSVALEREWFGGLGAELRISFRPTPDVEIAPYGKYHWARAAGSPGSRLASYAGGGVTFSGLFLRFQTLEQLLENESYVQTGLVPGLAGGASFQAKHCDGRERCDKGRTDEVSVTPFVELRVKSELQVRLSFVWSRFESATKDGTEAAATLTLAAAIGG